MRTSTNTLYRLVCAHYHTAADSTLLLNQPTTQEQRIRASHNFKKLSHSVKDRLTKGLKRTRHSGGGGGTVAAAAAAAAGDGEGSGSGSEMGGPEGAGSRHELANLIRKNGEEIATNVETVVEKVGSTLCVELAGVIVCVGW